MKRIALGVLMFAGWLGLLWSSFAWAGDEAIAWQKAEQWGELGPGKPYVVLMHGCAGITQGERNWGRVLSKLGYVVVAPDSLARPSRVQACDTRTASIRMTLDEWKVKVLAARHEEIAYALGELVKLKPSKRVLLGHSEGAFAVQTWTQGGFNAYVVSGTNCRGIRTEAGKPLLVLRFAQDPWDRAAGGNFCDGAAVQREGTKVFLLDGTGHDPAFDTGAQKAVAEFLE